MGGGLDAAGNDLRQLAHDPLADDGLRGVEARIVAEHLHLVAVAQPVVAQEPQLAVHLVVVGHDDAGVAPDVDDLQRVHGEGGGNAPGADAPAVELAHQTLAAVLDDRQLVALGDCRDALHLGDVAGEVHGHDRLGARGDRLLELIDVHAERVVAVDEDGTRAHLGDRADCGVEGIGGGDDLVAGTDAERAQRNFESICAGADADGVLDAERLGEHLLEFGNRLAEREIAGPDEGAQVVEHVVDFGELLRKGRVANSHGLSNC